MAAHDLDEFVVDGGRILGDLDSGDNYWISDGLDSHSRRDFSGCLDGYLESSDDYWVSVGTDSKSRRCFYKSTGGYL